MKTTVLMVLDGYGITEETEGNAVKMANTPNLDKIMSAYPMTLGEASGLSVGLPRGQMGNSEVGHTNIGAGRVVYQELTRIGKSIEDGDFFTNPVLTEAMENCKTGGTLHLAGLLSDGGVHSHQEHLDALLKMAKDHGLTKVYVHAFMDGRDTSPTAGLGYIKTLLETMNKYTGKLATISGRYYAMDRDKRWERVQLAHKALFGEGEKATNPLKVMEEYYAGKRGSKPLTDEFILPTVLMENNKPIALLEEGDSFVFFNFRPDRARELSWALCDPDFSHFPRKYVPLKYFCFTEYEPSIPNKKIVFTSDNLDNTLGEHLAAKGLSQIRMAETEKYPHVTFFFNGGKEKEFPKEDRILVPSPKVATYDLQPEMSAPQVTKSLIEAIESKKYDFILINYANPDMVGHTGDLQAVIKALETVDEGVGLAYEVIKKVNGQMFICADHGNADKMTDYKTKEPYTAHTTNPVPFIVVNNPEVKALKENGKLCDIAPTVLDMMGLDKPDAMTGESLLIR